MKLPFRVLDVPLVSMLSLKIHNGHVFVTCRRCVLAPATLATPEVLDSGRAPRPEFPQCATKPMRQALQRRGLETNARPVLDLSTRNG